MYRQWSCGGAACYGVPMATHLLTRSVRAQAVQAAVGDSRMKPVKLRVVGAMLRISTEELRGAEYLDGGNIVRTTAGALYHPLAMRRAEAIGAIALLSSPE